MTNLVFIILFAIFFTYTQNLYTYFDYLYIMDAKDKKILSELSNNSRIPLTQLSKKVALSREVINYRLKKLEKKVIKKYSSQINLEVLGFQRTGCYISLQNCSTNKEKEVLDFLIHHKYISAISTNIGKYDIIFDIFYKNNEQLQQIIIQIENFFKDKLKEFFFVSIPVEQKMFYNKLFDQKEKITDQKTIMLIKINKRDLEILKILNNNSRESLVNIAERININANAVGYRIKELEKRKIIEQSTIFIDFEELGFEIYNIQIKTNGTKDFEKIIQFLKNQKSVFYYYQYFGNKDWDIDIEAIIKNKKELKELIQEIKQNFGEIINFKEIYMIEKIFKEELPQGVFD